MKSLEELLRMKPEKVKLTPLLIAQYFISKGGNIDHLKLQKLVYYAQAWFVTIYPDKEPLFDEQIEAWSHGPVARSVHNRFRKYGINRLENNNYLWDEEKTDPM
ncbi:Panacea domain-containing protein [Bacillus sp. NPDC094106]|uniref:Panacea domain-containing protein n=1 Tax=Bacillus sp. NPDC094106 TaxID=3363949 RepID=UPI003810DCEE